MDNEIIIVEIFATKKRINLFDTDTPKALIKLKQNIIRFLE